MVNYQNGKIYKIEPNCDHEEGEIYIRSTAKLYLSQRMDTHRSSYKCWKNGKAKLVTSFHLFEKYGIENCEIILIEKYPCNIKEELLAREKHYTKTITCVNKSLPIRTKQEEIEYKKKHYEINKEQIKANVKEYQRQNKENIKELKKQYFQDNKDYFKEKHRENYEKNKEDINNKRKEKYICQCGSSIRIADKSRHEKSKKHVDYVNNL